MTSRGFYLLQKLKLYSNVQIRWNVSAARYKLQEEVQKLIDDEIIKPRKHPGVARNFTAKIPEWVEQGMRLSMEDVNKEQLNREQVRYVNYLFSRRLPPEENEFEENRLKIEATMLPKNFREMTEDQLIEAREKMKYHVNLKLKQKMFGWKPIEYTNFKSLLHMKTRSPAEYSAIMSIFNEIKARDPEFEPKTIFDFGSGVGSVLWAAIQQWKNINEYVGVDISSDMNELSEKIMQHSPTKIKGVFYRRYMPLSNLKHDLIVSAYSLMDLPNAKSRLEIISKLWKKTNKYLVIIEPGTNAGFKAITEAREFLIHVQKKLHKDTEFHTFAPCPHDLPCPRFREGHTPCNFLSQYHVPTLFGSSNVKNELYSYVVLKKDERKENDNWSRLVRPTIIRSKHARCRLCTLDGKLDEVVFTASKYGKPLYRCAKATKWGDRLPIKSANDSALEIAEKLDLEASENDDSSSSDDESEVATEKDEKIFISKSPHSTKNDGP